MKAIIRRKFQQNQSLADQLIGTQNKQLHEATRDSKWGIGAELASKALADITLTGQDILGNLLEQVREELARGYTHRGLETSISINQMDNITEDELTPMHMGDDELEGKTNEEGATANAPSPRAIQAQNKSKAPEGTSPCTQDSTRGTDVIVTGAKSKHSTAKKSQTRSAPQAKVSSDGPSTKSPTPPPRTKQTRSARAQRARDRKNITDSPGS